MGDDIHLQSFLIQHSQSLSEGCLHGEVSLKARLFPFADRGRRIDRSSDMMPNMMAAEWQTIEEPVIVH
ncbi:uncharacterized protein BCR38DRAFT_436758 [Pseudomassariella vexata]|uniref:Uncharacterized protein n=1 Tax=Pseudomassariella vexata TaxID=1141098 RepID=A0A1Y2DXQ6_9PEZI|nr:uncharacterized protein BCR38DRAFT_436758 [Pseudomassariella vexata]ORY63405.1 hypothetical protein BCR38DRAFT_436758 [Pseudomassariella vexata]